MQEATESSLSYESFESLGPRRGKKLGETEAYKVVEEICRESEAQINLAIWPVAEKLSSFLRYNALDDAMTYAQNDIVDLNPRKVSPEDIKKMARRALQVGFARSFPDSAIIQFPGMRAAPGTWEPKPWTWQEPETLARLDCLFGDHYWRGEVVSTVAPGGVGKSLLSIVEALAMITGRPLLGEATRGGLKVMLMNYEDSELVLRHRVTAAMLHYGIKPDEIAGKLFVESIGSELMRFAKGTREGTEIIEPSVEALTKVIKSEGIDVVVLDPWVSVHDVDGNLSHLIQPIVTALKSVAEATGVSIEIVAHSRKTNGKEMTEEDALGSVAFVSKTRDVRVLNKMAEEDAKKYGLAPWEAGDFFRVDRPKHTHTRSTKPQWMRKISVGLGNSGPQVLARQSMVGVVVAWSPPSLASLVEGLTAEQIEAIKAAVAAGLDRENSQAGEWAGRAVAKVLNLDVVDKGQKAKANITLKALIDAGHFKVEERPNPASRGSKCKHLVPADPTDEQDEAED